jgi:hypothetical protein
VAAFSVYTFPVVNHVPTEQEWNLVVQKEVRGGIALELGYLGKVGTHLERYVYFNSPTPGPGTVQTRRPYPQVGTGIVFEHGGLASYQALQAKAEKRFAHGLSFLVSYSWSKSLDDCSTDIGCTPQNPRDYHAERGPSTYDLTHNLVVSHVWDLPIGRGRLLGRNVPVGLDRVIGGWQLAGITSLHTGQPFTPTISTDNANIGLTSQRPNRLGTGVLDNPSPTKWFRSSDFTVAPVYTFGNSGRSILRGPGYANTDLAMLKTISLTEQKRLQFRGEAFNILNHPNFGLPSTAINTSSVGQITSASAARVLQLGLKLEF